MREHAPFHSQALNRSFNMLKKQLSICRSASLSVLSNEPELVCSKAQMGISGPVQQQGLCYYNNWQVPWFIKGPKGAIGETVMEQEVGKGWLQVQVPGSSASALPHVQQPWDQQDPPPTGGDNKTPEPILWSAAMAHSRLGLCLWALPLAPGCVLLGERAQKMPEKLSYWFSS